MVKDNLHIGTEARDRIIEGIKRSAAAVGGTMGTGGSNAILECIESPGHYTTNDGATILEAMHFEDELQDLGRRILLEAVKRANKQSGDGSSTTTVLTAAIIEEGIKHLDAHKAIDIKRSLEDCVPLILASIEAQKRTITVDEVGKVATISAEDEHIGALIQEIYQQIGPSGIIHWDISKTFADNYTIGKGITIEGAGFASPYMADFKEDTSEPTTSARLKNPKILITKQKITTAGDFEVLFKTLNDKLIKEVVIFCDEFEPTVIPQLVATRVVRGFKTVLIKMPVLWKDWWYTDLAHATGATVIDPAAGLTHAQLTMEHLGTVTHLTVDKDNTTLDGIKDVTAHVASLEDESTDEAKLRASRLNTKTARYFVGAASDSALSYRRLKVEDAISASYQALQGGIVAGGGVALRNAADELHLGTIGATIMLAALKAPFKQILANANIQEVSEELTPIGGYDTKTGKVVNMFEAGIVDPAPIVANAVRNAVSVAASILAAPVVITLPKQVSQ